MCVHVKLFGLNQKCIRVQQRWKKENNINKIPAKYIYFHLDFFFFFSSLFHYRLCLKNRMKSEIKRRIYRLYLDYRSTVYFSPMHFTFLLLSSSFILFYFLIFWLFYFFFIMLLFYFKKHKLQKCTLDRVNKPRVSYKLTSLMQIFFWNDESSQFIQRYDLSDIFYTKNLLPTLSTLDHAGRIKT